MSKSFWYYTTILFVLLVIPLTVFLAQIPQQLEKQATIDGVKVSVISSTYFPIPPGDTFTAEVRLNSNIFPNPADGAYGVIIATLDLTIDDTLLDVVSVRPVGPFDKLNSDTPVPFTISIPWNANPPEGDFGVAMVTFRTLAQGEGTIRVNPAKSIIIGNLDNGFPLPPFDTLVGETLDYQIVEGAQPNNPPVPTDTPKPTETPTNTPTPTATPIPVPECDLCGYCNSDIRNGTPPPADYDACTACMYEYPGNPNDVLDPPSGIIEGNYWSVIGCSATTVGGYTNQVITIATSVIGGISFLMLLFGGFTILVASGNPEKLARGKRIIFAGVVSLLIVIFSVSIMNLVGSDILNIPGF